MAKRKKKATPKKVVARKKVVKKKKTPNPFILKLKDYRDKFQDTWRRKKRIIIYGLSFFALILFFAWIGAQDFFLRFSEPLLEVYAAISSGVLNIIGQGTNATGDVISSSNFSIAIKKGCDAIAPMALYIVAVLAFPIPFKYKWPGVLLGIIALFALNILRIVYARGFFDFAHIQFWQVIFIILTVLTWLYWMNWANGKIAKHAEA